MRLIFTLFIYCLSFCAFAFEGIIHCKKIENGHVTTFEFYIKGQEISLFSNGPDGNYKILVDASRQFITICIDSPELEQKGYYVVTLNDAKAKDSIIINRKSKTDILDIDGEMCEGFTISTNIGSAIAYFSNENINLTGLSKFFNDPIYELIDAFNIQKLPKKMIVKKQHTAYTIDLKAEAKSLEKEIFQIPAGYSQLEVTATSN